MYYTNQVHVYTCIILAVYLWIVLGSLGLVKGGDVCVCVYVCILSV